MIEILLTGLKMVGGVLLLAMVMWLVWCSNEVLANKEQYEDLFDKNSDNEHK